MAYEKGHKPNSDDIPGLLPQRVLARMARQILKTMEATDLKTKDRVKLLAQLDSIRQDVARSARIRAERQAERLLSE